MRVTSKGQVTIPKAIRDHLGIGAGSEVEFVRDADGEARLRPARDGSAAAKREEAIRQWVGKVRGTLDTGGRTPEAYFERVRGPRDDLGPR